MNQPLFPKNFRWGVATSSYQIEGAVSDDGRAPSIWDDFSRKQGTVFAGHTGDVACDHYNRVEEDVELMRRLGVDTYRFSVCWPRVIPAGVGAVNEAGLAFYDRLIDLLLDNNIRPMLTLFHWDYPLELFHRGGWLNRDSADWFAEYTGVLVDRYSDRVVQWCTLNEPQVFMELGHRKGTHAPGLKLSIKEVLLALHHALLAHGKSAQVIRARAGKTPSVGWASVVHPKCPATDKPEDIDAARKAMFTVEPDNLWNLAWYADPIRFGRYPEQGLEAYGSNVPKFDSADLETIAQPLDYFGINTYSGDLVAAGADGAPVEIEYPPGHPRTAFAWPVTPEALYWGPRFVSERYAQPIIITENGMANLDWRAEDGGVRDPQRIAYLRAYLNQLARAIRDGADVRGYCCWSLLDNFEWAEGFRMRFGLTYVDFQTLERIPKDSFHFYRRVIETNGACITDPLPEIESNVRQIRFRSARHDEESMQ